MKTPITHAELDAMPDRAFLALLDFCSRGEQRGVLPYSRAKIWSLIKDGMIPPGRPKPGDNRPHPARVWTVAEVRAMVAAYHEGTIGADLCEAGRAFFDHHMADKRHLLD